ncbi:MAG: hypothetical protein NWF01_10820 [Candidatus Bathyarchaeota archaeon]|nr:hypothetical protein [Candidatus Bathyarchaeota archaeon]
MDRPVKSKFPRGGIVIFTLFTIISVCYLFEGNVLGFAFLWFSCILGVSALLDILVSFDREFNIKLSMGLLVAVISLGGILVNVYVFSVPANFYVRIFSVIMLVLTNAPLLVAVAAYALDKKELSKKLIDKFTLRGH